MKIPKIDFNPFECMYLDLDGVFADFNKRVFEISGKLPSQFEGGMWKVIMADRDFFALLEFMPDAEYLWEYTKQFNPIFLTGAPPGERSKNHKMEWVSKRFGKELTTIVLPKKDKQLYSGPNKVLIDDTKINIEQWISNGGHGVLHKNVLNTIEYIEELRRTYIN